jgi:hypothetical protein
MSAQQELAFEYQGGEKGNVGSWEGMAICQFGWIAHIFRRKDHVGNRLFRLWLVKTVECSISVGIVFATFTPHSICETETGGKRTHRRTTGEPLADDWANILPKWLQVIMMNIGSGASNKW